MAARKYKDGDLVKIPSDCYLVGKIVGWNKGYKVVPVYLGLGEDGIHQVPTEFLKLPEDFPVELATLNRIVLADDPNVEGNTNTIVNLETVTDVRLCSKIPSGLDGSRIVGRLKFIKLSPIRSNYNTPNITKYHVFFELRDCYYFTESDGGDSISFVSPCNGPLYSNPRELIYSGTEDKFILVKNWYDTIASFTVSGTIL